MEINADIYNWLFDAKILKREIKPNENEKYLLDEDTADSLENGLDFTPLIKRLNRILNQLGREMTPMPEMNSLKDLKTPSAKLYN